MDPTHILSNQAFQDRDGDTADRAEVDAFYDAHGLEFFAALSVWLAYLGKRWRGVRRHKDRAAGFAQPAHEG